MKIVELKTAAAFAAIWPLIRQHNAGMTKPVFTRRLKAMLGQGYRCAAAFDGEKMLGICGFWTGTKFWCGRYMDVDNVVVDASARSRGVGAKLLHYVENIAQKEGCDLVGLPAYTHNHRAHRFYFREGYLIEGYYFTKRFK